MGHGGPIRMRVRRQLGCKDIVMVSWLPIFRDFQRARADFAFGRADESVGSAGVRYSVAAEPRGAG